MDARSHQGWMDAAVRVATVSLAYVALRRLSAQLFVVEPAAISSFWPPSGLALAVLLRCSRRRMPLYAGALLLVAFVELLAEALPFAVALGWSVASVLEPLTGALLLRRALPTPSTLGSAGDVLVFVLLGAALGPLVGAVPAAAVSVVFLGGSAVEDALRWWMSSGLGVVLVAPLFLAPARRCGTLAELRREPRRFAELLLVLASISVLYAWLVQTPFARPFNLLVASCASLPFFIWAALRLGVPGVASASALAAAIVGWHVAHRTGIYGTMPNPLHEVLVTVQAYLAVGSISGLVLAGALAERRRLTRSQALLADVSALLTETLDDGEALGQVARRVVPELGEGCACFVERRPGKLEVAASAELDRELLALLSSRLEGLARDARRPVPLGLPGDLHALAVPLENGTNVSGWLVLTSGADERFSAVDRVLATEVAHRCSLAIARARLHRDQLAAVRARDDFLTRVSHELKTPLTPLTLQIDNAKRRLLAGDKVEASSLVKARQSLDRLVSLINDLLDSSRAAEGRLSMSMGVVPLTTLVEEVAAKYARGSPLHPVSVSAPDEELRVRGDRDRIGQVLSVLLDNAIKYSPLGGAIAIELREDGDNVRISVSDQGIGVPPEQQKHLFDRFFQQRSGSARSFGGLGLGLYIARDIVERHGGSIWMESGPEGGSTFSFTLPLASRTERTASRPASPQTPEGPSVAT